MSISLVSTSGGTFCKKKKEDIEDCKEGESTAPMFVREMEERDQLLKCLQQIDCQDGSNRVLCMIYI